MVNNKLFPVYYLMQNTTTPLLKSLRAVVQKQGTDLRKPEIAVLEKLELGRGGL